MRARTHIWELVSIIIIIQAITLTYLGYRLYGGSKKVITNFAVSRNLNLQVMNTAANPTAQRRGRLVPETNQNNPARVLDDWV